MGYAKLDRMVRYSLMMFITAFIFFLAGPLPDVLQIAGDNIGQIAYWHILFRPHLAGSIGAAAAKPVLMVLLGLTYDISVWLLSSPLLMKGLFAFFAAMFIAATARLTAQIAGKISGVVSAVYLVSMTPFMALLITGSSMIFFLPVLMTGLSIYAHGHRRLGIVMLCAALLIRQETVGVLLWLMLFDQLAGKRNREFLFSCLCLFVTLGILFFTYFRLQGDIHRLFFSSGTAAGYIFERATTLELRFVRSVRYVIEATSTVLFERATLSYLSIPALLALFTFSHRRIYLSVFGIVLFWIAYYSALGGGYVTRYFEFLIPLVTAFGWGGIFLIGKRMWTGWAMKLVLSVGLVYIIVFMINTERDMLGRYHRYVREGGVYDVFTKDAMRLMSTQLVATGSRGMTEDDIASVIVAKNPEYFRQLVSLQYFNVQDDSIRQKLLSSTDYIVIAKGVYPFYYLRYDPLKRGNTDPFRRTVTAMVGDNQSATVYGYRLTPIANSSTFLVVRVEPE